MRKPRKRRCIHCNELFLPDLRANRKQKSGKTKHQKFCSKAACQKARQRRTARKWRRSNHFETKHADIARVRIWRYFHPLYWRKHRRCWLIMEFLLPVVRLKKNKFRAKLIQPEAGALRIVNLLQKPGKLCLMNKLLHALQIQIGTIRCPCYLHAVCKSCNFRNRLKRNA